MKINTSTWQKGSSKFVRENGDKQEADTAKSVSTCFPFYEFAVSCEFCPPPILPLTSHIAHNSHVSVCEKFLLFAQHEKHKWDIIGNIVVNWERKMFEICSSNCFFYFLTCTSNSLPSVKTLFEILKILSKFVRAEWKHDDDVGWWQRHGKFPFKITFNYLNFEFKFDFSSRSPQLIWRKHVLRCRKEQKHDITYWSC